jgi:hypothetical protein
LTSLTVDAQGRITAASNGTAAAGITRGDLVAFNILPTFL